MEASLLCLFMSGESKLLVLVELQKNIGTIKRRNLFQIYQFQVHDYFDFGKSGEVLNIKQAEIQRLKLLIAADKKSRYFSCQNLASKDYFLCFWLSSYFLLPYEKSCGRKLYSYAVNSTSHSAETILC